MRKLLLLPLVIGAAVIGTTALVNAHASPVRFDPSPGQVLGAAPERVTGWFNSELRRTDDTFLRVLDSDGDEVQTGELETTPDRLEMSIALEPGLDDGRYVVYWGAVDDGDDHPVSGCYAFFIGQDAADAALEQGLRLDAATECPAEDDGHGHDGESSALIEIDVPEVNDAGDVTVTIRPTDFTPRAPEGDATDPNFGHYHVYLNKVPDFTGGDAHDHNGDDHDENGHDENGHGNGEHLMGGMPQNPHHWYENTYTFTDLEPGYHTVTVALAYDNHSLQDPPVFTTQTFRVEGDGDGGGGGVPVWALALGVVGGLVIGGAGMKLAAGRA